MTWKLSITVPDSKLVASMNALSRLSSAVAVEPVHETVTTDKPPGKRGVYVSVGPQPVPAGSASDKIVSLVMQLEKKHGAHRVTRKMLNNEIRAKKLPGSYVSNGVTVAIQKQYLVLT